jgi:hypothetical protein
VGPLLFLVSEAGRNTCGERLEYGSYCVETVNMFSTTVEMDFKLFAAVVFFAKVESAPLYFGICEIGSHDLRK